MQSASSAHPAPGPQGGHAAPPQSLSVSAPFLTESSHAGAWHAPAVHTPLEQSAARAHASPSSHGAQSGPPQSMSVSLPFLTLSMHAAGTQVVDEHTPLAQSEGARHSTHAPLPSQSLPEAPSAHAVPAATGVFEGTPALQVSAVQGFLSSKMSLSSFCVVRPPWPSQTLTRQSPGSWLPADVPDGA
jgi:hypothetical protein